MTKIGKLHDFLTEIQRSVQEKENVQRDTLNHTKANKDNYNDFVITHEHTVGQLYEINYILENFWRIVSEE